MITPDYIKQLKEETKPRAAYFKTLFNTPPLNHHPPKPDPFLEEARQLLAEGTPKEEILRAIDTLPEIPDKESLKSLLNDA